MSDTLQEAASGRMEPKRGFSAWIAGRASRKAYWIWIGPIFLGAVVLGAVGLTGIVTLPLGLVITLVWIRRLHDLGRTGWWAPVINIAMTALTFAAGAVGGPDIGATFNSVAALAIVIALGAIPGEPHANRFGNPPGKATLAETFS